MSSIEKVQNAHSDQENIKNERNSAESLNSTQEENFEELFDLLKENRNHPVQKGILSDFLTRLRFRSSEQKHF